MTPTRRYTTWPLRRRFKKTEPENRFGVTVFEILAVICLAVFVFKRKVTGFELGGSGKWLQAAIFMLLWVTFIIVVSLYAQKISTFWD